MEKRKSPYLIMVGQRIADRRNQLDLSQAQLAEKSGLSSSFISDIETGTKSLRAENLKNVAQALEISSDYLLTGQCNKMDLTRLNEILHQFGSEELLYAEEILKKLLLICQYRKEEMGIQE